ncbi:MAG: NAD(P)/FAD-dependent oxidoreductase [Gemmatimonadales bacterium]
MSQSPEIVVVGGGVVGAACARHLAREGRSVRVVESGTTPGVAWRASAGMLAAQVETEADTPGFALGISGREFYRDHAEQLRSATGIDIGLRAPGILVVAATEAEAATLKTRIAGQTRRGQPAEWLEGDLVQREWPWLSRVIGAQFAPRDGVVDPIQVVEAFRRDATLHGAELVTDTIASLLVEHGRVRGVEGRDRHLAEQVIIAAGAWSGRIANLPRRLPVEPMRGQILTFPWPQEAQPSIVFGHGGYVLNRGSEAVAGSTMENVGFMPEVTESGLATIRAHAESLAPSFGSARMVRAWAGLRPGTPDGLPIVGKEPNVEGLWYATGHGGSGVLLAGITGQIVADRIAGRRTLEGAGGWRVERFS